MTETIQAATIEVLPTGITALAFPTLDASDTLAGLQAAVGGYVECIDITHPETGSIATVWFNEEGLMNGLPINEYATRLLVENGASLSHYIVGNVIVTGMDMEEGETVALPSEWLHTITRMV